MTKDEEIRYLKFLLTMINNKIVNMTHPYNLTINEIQQEIRTLEDLREIYLSISIRRSSSYLSSMIHVREELSVTERRSFPNRRQRLLRNCSHVLMLVM